MNAKVRQQAARLLEAPPPFSGAIPLKRTKRGVSGRTDQECSGTGGQSAQGMSDRGTQEGCSEAPSARPTAWYRTRAETTSPWAPQTPASYETGCASLAAPPPAALVKCVEQDSAVSTCADAKAVCGEGRVWTRATRDSRGLQKALELQDREP